MDRPQVTTGSRLVRRDVKYDGRPAAIRYCNPGAMWPGKVSERYGSLGYGQLNDGDNSGAGNKIALYPNPVCGAAACMALLKDGYVGLTVSAGQHKWSNGHRSGLPGWDGNAVISRSMVANPDFVIPFMQSIAEYEAPGGSRVLSDAGWREAFDLYRTVEGAPQPYPKPVPLPVPAPEPQKSWLALLLDLLLSLFKK